MTDPNEPLFSLPLEEGAGAMLAAVAGDVAGGADLSGYSAVSQGMTVVAYHVMTHGRADRSILERDLLVMDGSEDGRSVLRGVSPQLRGWLDSAVSGDAGASPEPVGEAAAWSVPLGVWFRRDPGGLVDAAVTVARAITIDGPSVVAAAAVGAAVAGACFAQSGRDLVLGAAETADRVLRVVEEERYRFARADEAGSVAGLLRHSAALVDRPLAEIVRDFPADEATDAPVLGILLAAPVVSEPFRAIEAAAVRGGSLVGTITGGIVGARCGVRRWPWMVPNDTWFAAIGRRLVAGTSEVRDLPVPYAVEERLSFEGRGPV